MSGPVQASSLDASPAQAPGLRPHRSLPTAGGIWLAEEPGAHYSEIAAADQRERGVRGDGSLAAGAKEREKGPLRMRAGGSEKGRIRSLLMWLHTGGGHARA
eukprot:scaffold246_cov97-Isochrysis_galbana.AAC.1